jgi:hypothetical protein
VTAVCPATRVHQPAIKDAPGRDYPRDIRTPTIGADLDFGAGSGG